MALAEACGVEAVTHFAPEYVVAMGLPDAGMAEYYSALDVLVAPSFGEGFGVPILEAQACGRPVIVGGWTAMAELCFAGTQIPIRDAEPYWTPLGSWQYVPRVGAITAALEEVYIKAGAAGCDEATARNGALGYDVNLVTKEFWLPCLRRMRRYMDLDKGTVIQARAVGSIL